MYSRGPMCISKAYPPYQQEREEPPAYNHQTDDLYPQYKAERRGLHSTDYTMAQSGTDPKGLGYFSPQTTFYQSPQAPPEATAASGMSYLTNNPLLDVGFQALRRGMTDFTGQTNGVIPNQMKKSISSIRYYFAVDQNYVMKKLCLLLFPFRSRNWSLNYSSDEPVPPRFDTNAPDYYIPLMAAFTYVLIAGVVLGVQKRFTPEQLGMHASSALVWNIIEVWILSFILYIFNIQSKLRILDLIAYCGYKYVGMIVSLTSYFITQSLWIYRCVLVYVSLSLSYFLIKCLRLQVLSETGGAQIDGSHGNKRRIHFLLLIALIQPLFIWYMTQHLIVV